MSNPVAISYKLFDWSYDNEAPHGIAEISDLQLYGPWQDLGPGKKGIIIQGTKNIISFVLVTEEYDNDGDVTCWNFISDHEKFPGCALTIYND